MLEVQGLGVDYGGEVRAVEDVSFTLEAGKILAVVGESGCGKTSLARAIPRLLREPPAKITGQVWFDGVDLLSLSESALNAYRGKQIGMIFQEPLAALNPAYPAGFQVREVVARHFPKLTSRMIEARVDALFREVGLEDTERYRGEYPHELSGGLRQRVLLAIALAGEPRLLIADEPTSSLDTTLQTRALDLMRETATRRGLAVLLITHDLGVVARVADEVMVLHEGKLVERAVTSALFEKPQSLCARRMLELARSFSVT